jgi:hypothetical protein
MITYSNYSAIKRGSVGGLKSYFFTTADERVCTLLANKRLKFNGTTKILSLSLDNGATYTHTLDLTGVCELISRSKIYANGNIMWASHTKCYYSTDNLATYHESTVLNLAGTTFVPVSSYDVFKGLEAHNRNNIIGGVEIDVWGVYTIQGTEVNAWYTIDSGITIKSCFTAGISIGGLTLRHFESIDYDPVSNLWWAAIGDGGDSGWLKGVYNQGADTWTWTKEKGYVDTGNQWHISGFFFSLNGYVYWASDSGAAYHGFWKAPIATMLDNATYTKIRTASQAWDMTYGNEQGILISNEYPLDSIVISCDWGVNWEMISLTGAPLLVPGGYYNSCHGPDSNNWYRVNIQESTDNEIEYLSETGSVLMLQVIPTAGSN